ncbi:MAG: hypothetical protein RI918_661 [Pseudomonadota bacterium]
MFQHTLLATAALTASGFVYAQMSPVGTWNTIDDVTKMVKSEIVVTETAGVLSGKVTKLLRKDVDQKAICKECSDDRKDKPFLGLEIIQLVIQPKRRAKPFAQQIIQRVRQELISTDHAIQISRPCDKSLYKTRKLY